MTAAPVIPMEEEPRPVRFALEEYLRMAEDGYFLDQRTEFIDGEILRMPPQRDNHAYSITLLVRTLDRLVGDRHWVRGQMTLKIGTVAAPEPDVAVVPSPPAPGPGYPTSALFAAEVSDTTLQYDRTTKASLYAFAGVPEYWIVNLVDGRVEIHREPVEDHTARFGRRYGRIESLGRDATLALPASLGAAGAVIRAADILPPA